MKEDNLIEKLKVAVFEKIIPEIIELRAELYKEGTISFCMSENFVAITLYSDNILRFFRLNGESVVVTKENTTNHKFIIEFSKSAKKKLDELRKEKEEILEIINVQIPYKKKLLVEKYKN